MKIHILLTLLFFVFVFTLSCSRRWSYPHARKGDIVENFHGTDVADPYRWMEDPEAEETTAWVEAENKITEEFLSDVVERSKIKKRLTKLWDYPKFTVPSRHGQKYFFYKNDGLQNQYVLYVQDSPEAEAMVVIDPNKLSEDGTLSMSGTGFSENGKFLSYGLSQSGSDWQEIKIRNIETGKDFDETLKWCRFSGMAWTHDHKGFFYNRFPADGEVPPEDKNNFSRICYHKTGTPQAEDILVYERPDNKLLGFYPSVTDDGKYIILYVYKGTDVQNRIYFREVEGKGDFVRLLDDADAAYSFIDNDGPVFYFQTNLNAPRYKVIAVDIRKPDRKNPKEIIPEQEDVMQFVEVINDRFVIAYLHDAYNILKVYDKKGKFLQDIDLPAIGAISGLSGRKEDSEMFFGFTSFIFPERIYRYDLKTNKSTVFRESKIDFDPSGYETKQVFCNSKDGTRVPVFITHKKGITLDGNNPVILYAYGGFNVSTTPSFSVTRLVWLEYGGVYAVAVLRGGGEYGEEWHKAGMLENKQNVFDDFIAAAEWLIKNKYTSTPKLAIDGASNGGLLTAACLIQRPDLYGAVLSRVPVIDMLRYHKYTIGHYWAGEYGNAEENPEHFKFLYAYSPLHNIKKGASYPPTLVTTADTDDRVAPAHSKKFIAALQENDSGENPVLIRVETKAGHGAGKPTAKVIEEYADVYAFLFKTLKIE
ncbi:prolyl oligopeptidase family protein [candidate division KSB1 bacterium]